MMLLLILALSAHAEEGATSPLADPPPPGDPAPPAPSEPVPPPPGEAAPPAAEEPAPPAVEEPAPPPVQASPPPDPAPAAPAIDLSKAEAAPTLSAKVLRFFKPSPFHLPANPRGQIDFTAYTLEFGEVKLGVSNITIGILPHVQVGTSVPLDVLGIPNVQAKIHATEGGPFDIAAWGEYDRMVRSDFDATLWTVGGITSFQLAKPWAVHLGGSYVRGDVAGDISLDSVDQLLWFLDTAGTGNPNHSESLLHVEAVNARIATDIRFNRRDAIILQGSATLYAHVEHDKELWVPTFLGLEEALAQDGFLSPIEAGSASIAWQFSWEHWEARAGVGVSSIPGAWVLNTWELSYRFGGKTRVKEQRMLDTWQKNKEDLKKPPTPPKTPKPPTPPKPPTE